MSTEILSVEAIDEGEVPLRSWTGKQDDDGHRSYVARFLIEADDPLDGPFTVMNTAGLPLCGDPWVWGNDFDPAATAGCAKEPRPHEWKEGERTRLWSLDVPYTTKPKERCCEDAFDDPLTEPPKISITTTNRSEEAERDRYGEKIATSSHELIRGPQNEWDVATTQVVIEMNTADHELALLDSLLNRVNDVELWGLPERFVKFSSYTLTQLFGSGVGGPGCQSYWKRKMVFDIEPEGWDRNVVDEGTKALHGHWGTEFGAGLTVNISTTLGEITGVTLGAGGSGYPRSASFVVTVTGGGGTSGTVRATSNASGVVTEVRVENGGADYANTTAAATSGGGAGWILDLVKSRCSSTAVEPNEDNPSHFSRYLDQEGNPGKVILDGHGKPYDPCLDGEDAFWCMVDRDSMESVESFEGLCADAVFRAQALGTYIAGPFDEDVECLVEFELGDDPGNAESPYFYECAEGPGEGRVDIERYESDDLTLLGIPLDF